MTKEDRKKAIIAEFFQGDAPAFINGVFDGAQNLPVSRSCSPDLLEEYKVGHDYGRLVLCFENPRLFQSIAALGPRTLNEDEEEDDDET